MATFLQPPPGGADGRPINPSRLQSRPVIPGYR